MQPYQESKLSVNEQLLRLSAGPLCEAHIVVLHELLEAVASEAHRAEFAYHLGLRYAQKNDYTSSHKYFEVCDCLWMRYFVYKFVKLMCYLCF